nr:DUF58 domain-containing protein [uncultured Gellertiella sp.]
MAAIGDTTRRVSAEAGLPEARQRAALLPDCLVEARRIANTVLSGWHGRRKRGTGENFWQFRPYADGESLSRIDWRRSARDDHTYVRDREWQAAHTIWLHQDFSASMLYKSRFSPVSKQQRALVLMLALADILARSGERLGMPGIMLPVASRHAAEKLALAIAGTREIPDLPEPESLRTSADLVLFGDFLDDPGRIVARLAPLAQRGIRGHLVEIADPAEENFPYAGRTEFQDPESGAKLTLGRAEIIAGQYRTAYLARRQVLGEELRRLGWFLITHRTDRPATEPLADLYRTLSAATGFAA